MDPSDVLRALRLGADEDLEELKVPGAYNDKPNTASFWQSKQPSEL